jgi:hypothetical protein
MAVRLPDPAPGFAHRREPDSVGFLGFGGALPRHWVAEFGLSENIQSWSTPSRIGNYSVSTSTSTGPEATVFVSDAKEPVFLHGGKVHPRELPGTVPVAGVTGHLAEYTEMCATSTVLYFSTGNFTVEVIGHGATTDQLVALGNALTGLQ